MILDKLDEEKIIEYNFLKLLKYYFNIDFNKKIKLTKEDKIKKIKIIKIFFKNPNITYEEILREVKTSKSTIKEIKIVLIVTSILTLNEKNNKYCVNENIKKIFLNLF